MLTCAMGSARRGTGTWYSLGQYLEWVHCQRSPCAEAPRPLGPRHAASGRRQAADYRACGRSGAGGAIGCRYIGGVQVRTGRAGSDTNIALPRLNGPI